MAQNAQARSQPSAIFTYAHGTVGAARGSSSRSRTPPGLAPGGAADATPKLRRARPHRRTRRRRRPRAARRRARRRSARPCSPVTTSLAPRPCGTSAERQDGVDRLLARRLDERARVHHDDVGVVGARDRRSRPSATRDADDLVGVDGVLRAAERLDVEHRLVHCGADSCAAGSLAAPVCPARHTAGAVADGGSAAIWARRSAPSTSSTNVSFTWRRFRASHSTTGTLAGTDSASRTSRG